MRDRCVVGSKEGSKDPKFRVCFCFTLRPLLSLPLSTGPQSVPRVVAPCSWEQIKIEDPLLCVFYREKGSKGLSAQAAKASDVHTKTTMSLPNGHKHERLTLPDDRVRARSGNNEMDLLA